MSPLKLNDGHSLPPLGFGTWQIEDGAATTAVSTAIKSGYRLIDTAAIYGNEKEVGEGVRSVGIPRSELFVTTKLWNDRQHAPADALKDSLRKLKLEYVDLYLIHWPAPAQNRYVEAWRGLVELRKSGLARSIGVSNFHAEHLEKIISDSGVVPAVNQIELHPHLPQRALRDFNSRHGIVTQAWSPLGRGELLGDPTIVAIAKRLGRTPAQVVLRWELQLGLSTIPKSATPDRIRENFDLSNFTLSPDDLRAIDTLDTAHRLGPDPAKFG